MSHKHNSLEKIPSPNNNTISLILIDQTTMITTTTAYDTKRREDTLCKFIREYIFKVSQIVVSARRVCNNNRDDNEWNDLNAPYSQWFRIEMTDSLKIQQYIESECIGNWDARHANFELTIDISLSAEPLNEHVLLERWKIKFKREHINVHKNELSPSLIYKRMSIQIRSILAYLRLLPTHSIVQSWEQSMAQQSILVHNINKSRDNNIYGCMNDDPVQQNNNIDITPFALYHLIYSHHNKQNENISNFAGMSKSFSFEKLITKFGTIRTTVFYAANIRKDFEWLIRSVPGKNPPLINDNLSQHIDARSRYWDKKEHKEDNAHLDIDVTSNHMKASPNFELVNGSPEQFGIKALELDAQFSKASPPIKALSCETNFHDSPLLNPSTPTPKLDPIKEMEDIRRSIFGINVVNAPVLSIADVSHCANIHSRSRNGMTNMTDSQLINSIVKETQIISTRKTIMKTLKEIDNGDDNGGDGGGDGGGDIFDIETNVNTNDLSISSDMNCESDHDDIQDEIFKGYNDDNLEEMCGNVRQISDFINLCTNSDKLELESFKNMDRLLENKEMLGNEDDESKRYFNLLSKHFEMRQQKLIQLKKTASNVLENSVIRKQ